MEQLNAEGAQITGITCGMYNYKGSWEFDPIVALGTLNSDFPLADFPWKKFKFLDIYARSTRDSSGFIPPGMGDWLNDYWDIGLIEELEANGIDVDREVLSGLARCRNGKVLWLDQFRWNHIVEEHAHHFNEKFGIATDRHTIGNFVMFAIKNYPIIDVKPGRGVNTKIYIYNIIRGGKVQKMEVLVREDLGWIITAYPDMIG